MTLLQVMPDDDAENVRLRTTDEASIAATLREYGVQFTRWELMLDPEVITTDEAILRAYSSKIRELADRGNYQLVDVAQLRPHDGDPGWAERSAQARSTFRNEHKHDENEVRFFAAGRGCFYLHLGSEVIAVVCEAGDLLSVPASTLHWFDMGSRPDFVAIRFFQKEDGWIGDFTGNAISSLFPTLDTLRTAS
jgi:1,2-dihydroxy-3-keto-5-methylthiopentene dioxygenase